MLRMKHLTLVAGVIASLFCAREGQAKSQTFLVADQQAIVNANDAQGVYLVFGDLSALTGRQILYAKLYVSVAWDSCSGQDPELEVHVPTSQWSRSEVEQLPSWDSTCASIVKSFVFTANPEQASDGMVEILLNEVVQGWADQSLTKHGLLLVRRGPSCDLVISMDNQNSEGLSIVLVVESVNDEE